MKFNWGSGIAIFYTLFVVIMVFMVVRASQTDINMVQDNYYDQDLNYEQFRKSRQNGMQDGVLAINYRSEVKNVAIQFPQDEKNIRGSVQFYRPSDQGLDKSMDISLDEKNLMEVAVDKFPAGYWKVVVKWDISGKSYYREEQLVL